MSAGNCEMCGESTLRCRLDDRHWHLSYARVSAERDAMADKIVGAFGEGTTADMLVGISHDHEQQIASAEAERDAAVKEKLAALAKVKALREAMGAYVDERDPRKATENYDRIADAFYAETRMWPPGRSMPLAMGGQSEEDRDRACNAWRAFCDRWHERRNDEARAALASEVPPQPTTRVALTTPTDKEKTR